MAEAMLTETDANQIMAVEASILNDKRDGPRRESRTKWLNFLKRYVFQFFNTFRPSESAG